MNIVSNNCVGAWLYKLNKIEFNNPFIWSSMSTDEFISLVKSYNSIDFNNVIFSLEYFEKNSKQTVCVTLNKDIKIHYIHYVLDEKVTSPSFKSENNEVDVLYCDILNYAKKKYFERIKNINKNPIFVYSFNYQYAWINENEYKDRLSKIYELSKFQKIYVICNKCKLSDEYLNKQSNKFKLLQLSEEECKLYKRDDLIKINNFIENN